MKIKKTLLRLCLAGVFALSGCNSILENKKTNAGLEYWNFLGLKQYHETHPGDRGFLSGDAGSTELKSGYFFNLNFKENFGNEEFSPYGTLGFLVGYGEDREKNENDPRPIGHHSGIYSKIFPFAPQVGVGIESKINNATIIGLEATGTVFWIEHGWDRFGRDEDSARDTKIFIVLDLF